MTVPPYVAHSAIIVSMYACKYVTGYENSVGGSGNHIHLNEELTRYFRRWGEREKITYVTQFSFLSHFAWKIGVPGWRAHKDLLFCKSNRERIQR